MADYGRSISLSQARDLSNTSDEEDCETHSPRTAPPLLRSTIGERRPAVHDAANRKPRGRPPGSKNKPKPPMVVTRESDSAMKPVVLEISPGSDVIEAVVQFARRRQLGLTIISGSGTVSNVTLRHPATHAPSMTLHGPFNVLSLTGTFMGHPCPSSLSAGSFGISLAGAQGQVFGGIIAGKVMAATQVVLVAATFTNPTFHRLSGELEGPDQNQAKTSAGGGAGVASEGTSSVGRSISVYGVTSASPMNSCQVSPDHHHVIPWGPTSRPSPPPYN